MDIGKQQRVIMVEPLVMDFDEDAAEPKPDQKPQPALKK